MARSVWSFCATRDISSQLEELEEAYFLTDSYQSIFTTLKESSLGDAFTEDELRALARDIYFINDPGSIARPQRYRWRCACVPPAHRVG